MVKEGSATGEVTDRDQATWDANVEEWRKMAAKCDQIWRVKMEREKTERQKTEREKVEKEEVQAEDREQFSTDQAPVSSRFWAWPCAGHMRARRWPIRRRTRLNGDVFYRLCSECSQIYKVCIGLLVTSFCSSSVDVLCWS